jgi:hypothetical protein
MLNDLYLSSSSDLNESPGDMGAMINTLFFFFLDRKIDLKNLHIVT